jgi:hypothetical protein
VLDHLDHIIHSIVQGKEVRARMQAVVAKQKVIILTIHTHIINVDEIYKVIFHLKIDFNYNY